MVVTKISKKESKLPTSSVARFLAAQIDICSLSQKEIAEHIGYSKPNIITMFKQGLTKLPIEKVGLMAEALGVDPARLLKMTMEEYMPGTWDVIQDIVGYGVTRNEKEIIDILRKVSDDSDPRLRTANDFRMITVVAVCGWFGNLSLYLIIVLKLCHIDYVVVRPIQNICHSQKKRGRSPFLLLHFYRVINTSL